MHALVRSKPCQTFGNDQRIYIPATGLYTYSDGGVVCGRPQIHPKDQMSLSNPLVIVEVLSKSTAEYDRGEKVAHYHRIPSPGEILLVAQSEWRVEHHQRLETGQWLLSEHEGGTIELPALGGAVELGDIYDKIDFGDADEE